jgi:hypothetical protein
VLHVQLRAHTYVYLLDVAMPIAYWALPAWTFGVLYPSHLIKPLSGLTSTQWPGNDEQWFSQEEAMEIDE